MLLIVLAFAFSTSIIIGGEPAADFERFVVAATRKSEVTAQVVQHESNKKWQRRSFHLTDLKYDVVKTDSLLTPIVGLVRFRVHYKSTGQHSSRDAALAAGFLRGSIIEDVELKYVLRDSAWRLSGGRSRMDLAGKPGAWHELQVGSTFPGDHLFAPVLQQWVLP